MTDSAHVFQAKGCVGMGWAGAESRTIRCCYIEWNEWENERDRMIYALGWDTDT